MKIIYLAGPMSGHKDMNFPAFFEAEGILEAEGYEVVNPARINPDPNADWLECMRADIKHLVDCDGVYMLDGWYKSRGAAIEHFIAVSLGLQVIYQNDNNKPNHSGTHGEDGAVGRTDDSGTP